ncbi:hypothetical protein SteCoe_35881 [Stentor coeruleus]|uniref:Uncharacterized protein n=1 Tax=Stentor coeruleus TaxID=5963 RepID=A0A1R2AR97_9CILI|nr:hypothetical protein SteCoe_35881 [Stentor coeruleus]
MEKIERNFLIIGGLLKLGDAITDAIYISNEPFFSVKFYFLSIAFMVLPSLLLILILSFFYYVFKRRNPTMIKELPSFSLMICEQFGIASLYYGFYFLYRKKYNPQIAIAFFICKVAAFTNTITESMPQIVLQTYNSGKTMRATGVLIASCAFSGISILFSCCRIFFVMDYNAKVKSTAGMIGIESKNVSTGNDVSITELT